nr:dihydropteroate synthase [Acidimicrobiia bacterium]
AEELLGQGAFGLDLGGQGSTPGAGEVDAEEEWRRLAPLVPALARLGVPLAIDTWRVSVARRALDAGATWLNAADGLQGDEILAVAAAAAVPVVVPFLAGPHPKALRHVEGDPVEAIDAWFERSLARIDAASPALRARCVLDPGTGFAPADWPWPDRYLYQKQVYGQLGRLRRFGLPLYVALPWRDTPEHAELLDLVLAQGVEYGRAHHPDRVLAAQEARGAHAATAQPTE